MKNIMGKLAFIFLSFCIIGATITLTSPKALAGGGGGRPHPSAPPNLNPFNSGPPMSVQGTMTQCVYCTQVRPTMKKSECPLCHGRVNYFQPARMMDRWSSWVEVVGELQESVQKETEFMMKEKPSRMDAKRLRENLITLLRHIDIYGFDPKKRIAERIRQIEDEHKLAPKSVGYKK